MPGLSGLDVARHVGNKCHIVFVTAYDKYAVAAFEQGGRRLRDEAVFGGAAGGDRRAT
jgi:DNA-binding LytR/AlgR family response regulator